jgi:hypothetical protein
MSASGRPEQTVDEGVIFDAKPASEVKPACMALVPMVTSAQWSQIPQLSRSDSTFVAHLIATAEHVPQTCSVRRATPADAQSAYSANQHRLQGAGMRARQII